MKTTNKSGFQRLRGLAAAGVAATAGLFSAGTARAATFSTGSTVTVSSIGGDTQFQAEWTEIGNNTMSSFAGYTTTGGAVQTLAYGGVATGDVPTVSPFDINDASITNSTTSSKSDAYDGFFGLAVGDKVFSNPDGDVDLTDNTVTSDVVHNLVPGIDAQIKYHFFDTHAAVRAVFALTNTTAKPIKVPAVVFGNYGSDGSTTMQATSSGDTVASSQDKWYLSNDNTTPGGDPSDPAVLTVRYGDGAKVKPIALAIPGAGAKEDYADQFNITIPPHATVRIMGFSQLGATNDLALVDADKFSGSLNKLGKAGLLEGMSAQELNSVVNYGYGSGGGALPLSVFAGLLGLLAIRRRQTR